MSEDQHWRKIHRRLNEGLVYAEDIGPPGSARDVEIVDSGVVTVKSADGAGKPMPWIGFAKTNKKLALNVTNCKTLQAICGSGVVGKWRGWVTLVVVETTFFDQKLKRNATADAVRIAPTRPKIAAVTEISEETASVDPAE